MRQKPFHSGLRDFGVVEVSVDAQHRDAFPDRKIPLADAASQAIWTVGRQSPEAARAEYARHLHAVARVITVRRAGPARLRAVERSRQHLEQVVTEGPNHARLIGGKM
jgi:hypothetical protein